jgi:hypothetical protein
MLRSGFGDGCSRLSRLVDEEAEADEEFWGQDAFKEVRFHQPWNQAFRIPFLSAMYVRSYTWFH